MSIYYNDIDLKTVRAKRKLVGNGAGGAAGSAAASSLAGVIIGSISIVLVLALGGWTIAQQVQANDTRSLLTMQQVVIDTIVMPLLNETEPFQVTTHTLDAQARSLYFTNAGPPPSAFVTDSNWNNVRQNGVGECKAIRYNIGGVIYGVVEYPTNYTLPALASDSTSSINIQLFCNAEFTGLSPVNSIIMSIDTINLTPSYTLVDNRGTAMPPYPRVQIISDTPRLAFDIHSHNENCGVLNPICNTVPAGTTFGLSRPLRVLTHFGIPPL